VRGGVTVVTRRGVTRGVVVRGVVARGGGRWLVLHYGDVLLHKREVGGLLGFRARFIIGFCVLLSCGRSPSRETEADSCGSCGQTDTKCGSGLSNWLDRPTFLHNRCFSPRNVYLKDDRFKDSFLCDEKLCLPTDEALFTHIMGVVRTHSHSQLVQRVCNCWRSFSLCGKPSFRPD
jgi:hypothetical protein